MLLKAVLYCLPWLLFLSQYNQYIRFIITVDILRHPSQGLWPTSIWPGCCSWCLLPAWFHVGRALGHHPTDSLASLLGRSPCVALTSFSFLVYPSCWSLSSSSFLRKGMWEINFLRPCMSKDSFILPSWFGECVAEHGILGWEYCL